jgi:hypothetical protein
VALAQKFCLTVSIGCAAIQEFRNAKPSKGVLFNLGVSTAKVQ